VKSQEVAKTIMTQSAAAFALTRHRLATTGALVVLFWLAAAAAVGLAHRLEPVSPAGAAAAAIGSIVLAAFCYTRFCARRAGITHALGVGIAWLILGIATEIVMTTHPGHAWYPILGSPDRPLLRNIVFFAWVFAPAIFARRQETF
jgi:hypothetical protein